MGCTKTVYRRDWRLGPWFNDPELAPLRTKFPWAFLGLGCKGKRAVLRYRIKVTMKKRLEELQKTA